MKKKTPDYESDVLWVTIYSFIVPADNQFDSGFTIRWVFIIRIYVEFYVELDINVGVVSFDLINMIFDKKLVIGENVDFLWIFVFI